MPKNKSNSTPKSPIVPPNKKASQGTATNKTNAANSKKKFVPFAKKGK